MGYLSNNLPSFEDYKEKGEWRSDLHPRDEKGRFAHSGSSKGKVYPDAPEFEHYPGYVGMIYPPDYKSYEEASKDFQDILAKSVSIPSDMTPETLSSYMGMVRVASKYMPLGYKIDEFSFTNMIFGNGRFAWSYPDKNGNRTTRLDIKPGIDAKVYSPEELHKMALDEWERITKARQRDLDKLNKLVGNSSIKKWLYADEIEMRTKNLNLAKNEYEDLKKEVRRPTIGWTSDGSSDSLAGGILLHEYGHAWHYSHQKEVKDFFGIDPWNPPSHALGYPNYHEQKFLQDNYISVYGTVHPAECFTENFVAYFNGQTKSMSPKMVKFFDKQTGLDFEHKIGTRA
jgi:hypothetical protein